MGKHPEIGICGACRHVVRVESGRGSLFWRCRLAETDSRLPKYPRLPLPACWGFEADEADEAPKR